MIHAIARLRRVAAALPVLGVLLIASLLPTPPVVHAAPTAAAATVEAPDPASMTFKVSVQSDADLAEATLNYTLLNASGANVGGSIKADVAGGKSANLSATLQTNSAQRYIPVGTKLTYSWTVTDKNGGKLTTPSQDYVFLDGRFQWTSKTSGLVTVYWYGGNDRNANDALQGAADSIDKNQKLLNVTMPYPIRIVVYRNSAEGKPAQQPRGATFEANVITGGSRVGVDLIHFYDPLNGGLVDVVRHETGHIVTRVAGFGSLTSIPSWLDEGTAVYSQLTVDDGYQSALRAGIRGDQLLRLRNLQSAVNQPDLVNLFYGENWAVVKFMVDTYGQQKFAAVFSSVKGGLPIDVALKQSIGVDQDGLYNAWRKSIGLKEIDFPPIAEATTAAAVATQPPLRIPSSLSGADSTSGGTGGAEGDASKAGTPVLGIAVGVVSLLVAGGIGFLGLRLSKKR